MPTSFKAEAVIAFPRVQAFLENIVASLASHDMAVTPAGHGFAVETSFGTARLEPGDGELLLVVETCEPASLNRLKHGLTGLITFTAKSENLDVRWSGDCTGPALPPDLRVLTVDGSRQVTPRVKRLTLRGDNLERYAVPDQIHGRLLFQAQGTAAPRWPMLGDDGRIIWPADRPLASRIYTIRRIDLPTGTIDIDFVMHDRPGPASRWASTASPGDQVGILGPAAHGPREAAYYVLAGDETGLPGIARILDSLPSTARGVACIEVADAAERQDMRPPGGFRIHWLYRNGAAPGTTGLLADAIRGCDWPRDGDVFFWGGYEFSTFRDIRRDLRDGGRLAPSRQVSFPHWRRGMSEDDIVAVGGAAISA